MSSKGQREGREGGELKRRRMAGAALLLAACGSVLYGLLRGEAALVLGKAVNICLECIGLG